KDRTFDAQCCLMRIVYQRPAVCPNQHNGPNPMATASTATSREIIELFNQYVGPNYARSPVALVRGEGSLVWDAEDNRYLDFFPGWGCNLLGHCPRPVVRAGQEQVATLIHVAHT